MGRLLKNDLKGKWFGDWCAYDIAFVTHKGAYWHCKCNGCGKIFPIRRDSLLSGRSCRCRDCANKRKVSYKNV